MQGTRFLRQAVACQPNGVATISGARRRTWNEVGARVPRLAAALRAFGVADGAFVAALGFNSDRYVELFFAVPWAGGAFAPLNIRWSPAENAYALTDSHASVLFVDESFVDQARELKAQLDWVKTLVFMGEGETPEGMIAYEDLIARHEPMEDANRSGEDLWVIFYTGGTTSHPEGRDDVASRAVHRDARLYRDAARRRGSEVSSMSPASSISPARAPCSTSRCSGGTHVLLPKFEPCP